MKSWKHELNKAQQIGLNRNESKIKDSAKWYIIIYLFIIIIFFAGFLCLINIDIISVIFWALIY